MSELDDFYELLNELRAQTGGPRTLEECTGSMNWPKRGVYFSVRKARFEQMGRRVQFELALTLWE